ncbi:MAG TPA: hypothetical protein VIM33_01665 [Gaiellaceae bacterium]|jgi:hypothetical protein
MESEPQTPASAGTQETEDTTKPDKPPVVSPPWWKRAETWSLGARLVMGSAGVAAIAVGLVAAARTHVSTTALIVGAVLIALAILFTPDLEEFGGEYGPAKITYRRSAGIDNAALLEELTNALRLALTEQGESKQRALEELTERASEATKQAYREALAEEQRRQEQAQQRRAGFIERLRGAPSSVPTGTIAPTYLPSSFYEQLAATTAAATGATSGLAAMLAPRPSHRVTEDEVVLTLTNAPAAWLCAVTNPQGQQHRTSKTSFGSFFTTASVRYPQDFGGAPPLEPGPYGVQWKQLDLTYAEGKVTIAPGRTVAIDRFEVPESPKTSE